MLIGLIFLCSLGFKIQASDGILDKIAKSLTEDTIPHSRKDLATFFNRHGLSTLLISHFGLGRMEAWLEKGFFILVPNPFYEPNGTDSQPDLMIREMDETQIFFYGHQPINRNIYAKFIEERSDFSFFVFQCSWDFLEGLFLSFNSGLLGRQEF